MKQFLLLLLLGWIVQFGFSQSKEIDNFYEVFHSDSSSSEDVSKAINMLPMLSTNEEEILVLKALQIDTKALINTNGNNILTDTNLVEALKETYKELLNYAQKDEATLSSNFLTQLANLRIRVMGFEDSNEMIKLSNSAKQDYENAIKKDSKNFLAYLGLGQWYYYAPKAAGGDLKKSRDFYKKAEKIATLNYQKYLVAIWTSQSYFKESKKSDYEKQLAKAVTIYPNGEFLKSVKKTNAEGKSL